jgi:hypothetical protein
VTPILVGALLAVAVGLFATVTGFDRDRAFYPTVAIVVASYYCLYAVLGGSMHALALETVAAGAFLALAVLGFRSSLWFAAIALGGHGAFDIVHTRIIANPGLPVWWPGFCAAYDIAAAAYLAWLLTSRRTSPR